MFFELPRINGSGVNLILPIDLSLTHTAIYYEYQISATALYNF